MKIPHRVGAQCSWHLSLQIILAFAVVLLTSQLSTTLAQTTDTSSRIYRLAKTSTFQRGCFAPCLCPMMEQGTEEGTFVLTPAGSDGMFNKFVVSEVNWTVTLPSGNIRVTGGGIYKVGGEVAVQQELSLDLKVGDNAVQHFDSGLVAGGGDFPRINTTISINGQFCFDTVFMIDAAPVPVSQVQLYRLLPESTFQRSCSGPCACAPGPQLPMAGIFSLVELDGDPLFSNFAVARVKWVVAADPSSATTDSLPVTGSGTYRLGGEVAVEQQMSLDLMVDSQPPVLFESGVVPGGGAFPRIDVQVINGADSCVTTVMNLHAKPVPLRTKAATPPIQESIR